MKSLNLTWAIVFTVMFIAGIVGMFWNPSHWITIVGCGLLAGALWYDYAQERKRKK